MRYMKRDAVMARYEEVNAAEREVLAAEYRRRRQWRMRKFLKPPLYTDQESPRVSLTRIDRLMALRRVDTRIRLPMWNSLFEEVLLPVAGFDSLEPTHEMPVVRPALLNQLNYDRCAKAEPYFARLYRQIMLKQARPHTLITVYYDDSGTPLMLEKLEEAASALSLTPIQLGGIALPAGSLVKILANRKSITTAPNKEVKYRAQEAQKGIIGVEPLRISPWAYADPLDRALFGVQTRHDGEVVYAGLRAGQASSLTIGDFQEAAAVVMQMCGLSEPCTNH